MASTVSAAGYGYWNRSSELKPTRRLRGWKVVNGSVSGETTAGGLARLPAALARHQPSLVLIELGANDGLRGLDLKQMRGATSKR